MFQVMSLSVCLYREILASFKGVPAVPTPAGRQPMREQFIEKKQYPLPGF